MIYINSLHSKFAMLLIDIKIHPIFSPHKSNNYEFVKNNHYRCAVTVCKIFDIRN